MQKLDTWEKDNESFVPTRASEYVLNCLMSNSCVTVTGGSGVGKTVTVRHVALRMKREKDYDIVPIASPKDIRDFYTRGKPTVFIVDDLCGNYTANQQLIEHWKQFMDDIKNALKDSVCKLMVTCRLQVFRDDKLTSLTIFKSCECNLSSEELSLTTPEKQTLAKETFLGIENEVMEQLRKYEFFPLLCSLFHGKNSIDIKKCIDNPFLIYKEELDLMFHGGDDGKHKYCALALVVMFNNDLEEASLTGKTNNITKTTIEETCEACHLNKGISKLKLKAELDILVGTYVTKEDGIYHTIHDRLFDFMADYFGQQMIQCFIDNGDSALIGERFLWESYKLETNAYDNIDEGNSEQEIDNLTEREHIVSITFSDDMIQMYIERMIKDLRRGKVADVINNRNMKSGSFRDHFLHHINLLDESIQEELARVRDNVNHGTTLYHACYCGFEELSRWLCQHGTDVRICNDNGRSPLHAACDYGYLNIVNLILQETAKISKTAKRARLFSCIGSCFGQSQRGDDLLENTDIVNCCDSTGGTPLWEACLSCHEADVKLCHKDGTSPLNMTCQKDYLQVVCRLLESKADANKTDKHGFSPLYLACYEGHVLIISKLLDYKANVNEVSQEGISPLYVACYEGHLDVAVKLLDHKASVNQCDQNGCSPLYAACQEGHLDIAVKLLDYNANVNQCNRDGCSPLYVACGEGHLAVVVKLLDYNASVNQCDQDGISPLCVACRKGHLGVAVKLLENKANVNQCDQNELSPLYVACYGGHLYVAVKLLDNKASVNQCDKNGCSPLYAACQEGHLDVAVKLLDNKASVNQCTKVGCSPLYIACQIGELEVAAKLLENEANVNQCDQNGWSPLHVACHEGHLDVAVNLLDNKASVNQCNKNGLSPLYVACREGHLEVAAKLLNYNANVNQGDKNGITPLYRACEEGHVHILNKLLDYKANVNEVDDDGFSPLYVACQKGHLPVVCKLLESSININQCNIEGTSPLSMACQIGHLSIVSKLLECKADVNKSDNDDISPLYIACQDGYKDIVEVLLENNANINLCSFDGGSPLLISCTSGHSNIVELLLEGGADVTKCLKNETQKLITSVWLDFITDPANNKLKLYLSGISPCNFNDIIRGFSPLHMACLMGHIKIIKLFLAQNADVNICKEDGTTPLYVACAVGHADVVRLLLENQADPDIYRNDGKSPFTVAESNEHFNITPILQQYFKL